MSTSTTLSAYGHNGRRIWDSAAGARTTDPPLSAPDGAWVRVEGSLIVARRPDTGTVVGQLTAPGGANLTLTPWGDLLYTEHRSSRTPSVHCVSPSGRHRWSRHLDALTPPSRPFPLADLVVIPRRGALWGVDREGSARWVAGPTGVYPPHPTHDTAPPSHPPAGGVSITAPPIRLDPVRALVSLRLPGGQGLFLLDAATAQISPVAAARALRAPFAAVPAPGGGYRVAAATGPAGIGSPRPQPGQEWARPREPEPDQRQTAAPGQAPAVIAVDPGGAVAWEHSLIGTAHALLAAGPDRLVLATRSRDASRLECLAADGTVQWHWHAPGPFTHQPVAAHGTVYVGSNSALWALPVRPEAVHRS